MRSLRRSKLRRPGARDAQPPALPRDHIHLQALVQQQLHIAALHLATAPGPATAAAHPEAPQLLVFTRSPAAVALDLSTA